MAKGSKLKRSESEKGYFANYPKKAEDQRKRRQNRHLRNHPNDQQAANAGTQYRRQNSKTINGWLTRNVVTNLALDTERFGPAMSRNAAQQGARVASIARGCENARRYDKNKSK